MAMAVVALLGLFLGTYLTLYKFGYIGTLSCGTGGCEQVQTSRWSMLFGLPIATWGMGFYAAVLVLSVVGIQPRFEDSRTLSNALLAMTGWGVVFTAWLTYLEGNVIHAWCRWCLGSAAIVVVLLVLAVWDRVQLGRVGAD